MKNTIQEKKLIYDILYEIADRILKEYNPCDIRHHKEGRKSYVTCVQYNKYYADFTNESLCCNGCSGDKKHKTFLGENGCIVKCLACKLYLCGEARAHNPVVSKLLSILKNIGWMYGLDTSSYYMSKEMAFGENDEGK